MHGALLQVSTRYPLEFAVRDDVVNDKSAELLRDISQLMTENESMRLSIEGHTDDQGASAENARLSVNRAQAVAKHLSELGIDGTRLVAHGFGATLPLEDNSSDEGRARNRRVQFLVIPDVRTLG